MKLGVRKSRFFKTTTTMTIMNGLIFAFETTWLDHSFDEIQWRCCDCDGHQNCDSRSCKNCDEVTNDIGTAHCMVVRVVMAGLFYTYTSQVSKSFLGLTLGFTLGRILAIAPYLM